jgi:hypothetical protein
MPPDISNHAAQSEAVVFSMPIRRTLPTALRVLAAAACGGSGPQSEDGAARDLETWARAGSLRESAIRRVYADLNGELVIG